LRALEDLKINEPTEIQEKIIPIALSGQDVRGESATGSGKTLAFGAPIIEKTRSRGGLQVLVMTPTRELAEQVARSLKSFSRYNPLEINTVYGGVPIDAQIRYLKKSDIIVGTPGRILDHISRKTIDLSKIKILVLDEADRMLDMGFIYDVTDILHYCPKEKQTLLFSATLSDEIIAISRKYMKNPKEISAEPEVDPSKLRQVFYDVPSNQKFSLLVHLLKQEKSGLVMIFCNTKRNADLISENLSRHGFDAMALHGNLSQTKRSRVLEKFHQSQKFILVCTDVAARGLDIKGVSHVYNYEFPKTRDEYTHRIGRTARAGKDGKAITILSDRDYQNFRNATKYDSKVEILPLPRFEQVVIRMKEPQDSRSGSQGRFGKNPRGRNTRSSGPRSRGNSAPRSSNPRSSSPRGRSPPRGRNYSRR
ncbi:MAG: DEAD/DEAH box helicase, partial [Nanoarchaeota archaeon]|nr:DEAD/DEAH box helicase [Nanoarchaeota archaeon]